MPSRSPRTPGRTVSDPLTRARGLLALLASTLVGCGGTSSPLDATSPWPKFRADLHQTGRTPRHLRAGGAKWTYHTKKGVFSSPVVGADGTVYVGSADRSYYALDRAGTLVWQIETGEIIDSSGLLDDEGRIYFGSGDGKLRAADAKTGAIVWQTAADDPSVNMAYINWFEGNVAITASGRLIVPNDNYFVYGVDRDAGSFDWKRRTPDQTWAAPAVDDGSLYIVNNNAVDFLGANTTRVPDDNGTALKWEFSTAGTNAASPMLPSAAPDLVMVASFDGYLHALSRDGGMEAWTLATRDHIYASPAELADGTVVIPSTDGTIYAVEPKTGALRWAFDTLEPIRSSPAVDGDDHVYFGSGDGRLYVLNGDGTKRWSMQLIDDVRNDLNASPALGSDAIYIAGESGDVFSVPFDYCLLDGKSDPACESAAGEGLPADGLMLVSSTAFGAFTLEAPTMIDANQQLGFTLISRQAGDTELTLLDANSITITSEPATELDMQLSGDGRFLLVAPKVAWPAGSDGTVKITITAQVLGDPDRVGLKMSGGTPVGMVSLTLTPMVIAGDEAFAPAVPAAGGPQTVFAVDRLTLPLPTMLPSYNQIGFDSLGYVIGIVSMTGDDGLAVMLGGLVASDGSISVDPATRAVVPLALHRQGSLYTLANNDGLSVEVMNAIIPFHDFRITAHFDASGNDGVGARLDGSSPCADVPTYGLFLDRLGMCNAQTGRLTVFGAANLHGLLPVTQPSASASFTVAAGKVKATLTGAQPNGKQHFVGLLLVDTSTGAPITLDYGLATTTVTDASGAVSEIDLDLGGHTLPAAVTAMVLVDTYPAASGPLSQ